MAQGQGFSNTGTLSALIPSPLINGVTGVNNLLGSAVSALPQTPQYFFTVPFANNQPVLYQLQIVTDASVLNAASFNIGPISYTFPLTPRNVTKSVMNLTNYYDIRGDSTNYGVQRIIDVYGLTPPIITIAGTTGFQFHSLDNYNWSGKSSFALLVQIIQQYAKLVAFVSTSTQPLAMPIMQFTDGFTGELFNVVPISKQAFEMDVSKPIIQMYNLQFLAQNTVTPTAVSLSQQDPISQAFILAKALSTAGFLSTWNSILSNVSLGTIS